MTTTRPCTGAHPPPPGPADDDDRRRARRDSFAIMVFSTWTVIGLFLDGWSHNNEVPESFFSPWHALLYSGFGGGVLWFAGTTLLDRRAGRPPQPTDRLVLIGFGLFGAAGFSDMVWHLVFGIEQDIEALLSPSHLLLMTAGLLVLTGPVRGALGRRDATDSWIEFAPVAVALTLSVSVILFFLQFTALLKPGNTLVFSVPPQGEPGKFLGEVFGVDSVLITNALLCGSVLWIRRQWRVAPPGTFTLFLGGSALLMAGLSGFDGIILVLPVVLAGMAVDVLASREVSDRTLAIALPAMLWAAWFATLRLAIGLTWAPELWAGTIVLAVFSGYRLHLLQRPEAATR